MMAPNRVKLEMLGQRIGQRRDATRALTQVPTGWGSLGCPTSHTVGQKAVNPRGMGTASPYQISSLPDSKKELKKDVDKGWGVLVPLAPAEAGASARARAPAPHDSAERGLPESGRYPTR